MRAHPVERCLNESCEVDFADWSSIQRRYALGLFAAGAVAAICAVMTVGVALAWNVGVGEPVRDAAIVAGLALSLAVGGHLVRQIAIAPVRIKGKIEEISNVIEGEIVNERI